MIRAVRLLEHTRRLATPMASAAGSWTERAALTLVLEDEAGHRGLGEAAPLPGYSKDPLDTARTELGALLGSPLRDVPSAARSASARCALESALLDLRARQARVPAWQLPRRSAQPAALELSLWLPNDLPAALAAAQAAASRGIRSFKVKLNGLGTADPGLALLEALRREHGPTAELRADANQSGTRERLAALAPTLERLAVRWVEEPAPPPLPGSLGFATALDESLAEDTPDFSEARAAGVVAVVLKPTLLGGVSQCLELARLAREAGITAVASHTLEGPLGMMAAATLALALGPGRPADGLAPHAGLGARRPPCFAENADHLVAWDAPGFGLTLEQALEGAHVVREESA